MMKAYSLLVLFIISSCSVFNNEQNLISGKVLVSADDPFLNIMNNTNEDVHFIVIESNLSHVIDFAFTCEGEDAKLKSQETIQIAYSDIYGWNDDAESVWIYWGNCDNLEGSETIKL